jgi:hypothetical protein
MTAQIPHELSGDARERLSTHETDQLYRTVRTGVRCLTTAFIFYYGFRSFETFAGEDTNLSIALTFVLRAFAELKTTVFIGLTGTCAAWAILERILRQRKVEYMQGRIKELEQKIDPNRTSSDLTPKGQTNPRDRIR